MPSSTCLTGVTLVSHDFSLDDYEHLLDALSDRPRQRASYDRGRLEIKTPLAEHEPTLADSNP